MTTEAERIRAILIDLNAAENHARAAQKALVELAAEEPRWERLLWEVNMLVQDFEQVHRGLGEVGRHA